jgi:hypothetical protein
LSTDGDRTFTDQGDLPWYGGVQSTGDPSLATDDHGNVFCASLGYQGHFSSR